MSSLAYKDVKGFVELEKELTLFNRSYDGFYYWQYIRFYVCESLFGNRSCVEKQEKTGKKRPILDYFSEIVRALIETVKAELALVGSKYELVVLKDAIIKDKFFDTWELPDDISSISLRTTPYFKEHGAGDLFLEWPRLKSEVEDKLKRKLKRYKKDQQEKAFLVDLEKRLIEKYGQSITADEIEALIHKFAVVKKHYSKTYIRLFKKTNCSAIACTCYYSDFLLAAHEVAQKSGISIIEFQHGVINNHEEYWFEDDRGVNNFIPDYLLTFGEIHNSWIKLVKGKKAIAVGFPFQEKSILSLNDVIPNEKEIVIYPDSDSRFEETINSFIEEIVTKGYHVIIKLHPLEANNVKVWYPILSKNKNAELITSQKEGIYYWLKRAKHHIMASTTVGLEAVAFDHSNVCIATHVPHDQVQCLLDWGIARGFSTSEELVNLILDPIDLRTKEAKRIRRELWSENASENMTAFFRDLKQNGWKV